jgi:hypothetical protein
MPRHAIALALILTATLPIGCFAGPQFRPREPPTMSWRVPTAPQAPAPVLGSRGAGGDRTLIAARPLDDLRARTLAVALRTPDSAREYAWPMLARQLLSARFTRVLPPTIMSLHGTIATERGGAHTTVEGDLQPLLLLRAETPADVLIAVDLSASAQIDEASVTYEPGALEAYESAYTRFQSEVVRARRELSSALATWTESVHAAEAEYTQRGGQWRDADDVAARDNAQVFLNRAQAFDAQLDGAARAAVSPPDLVRRASQARAASREQVASVRLRATITDLSAGQTGWMLELTAQRPDEASAVSEALARLVAELAPSASAPPNALPPVP